MDQPEAKFENNQYGNSFKKLPLDYTCNKNQAYSWYVDIYIYIYIYICIHICESHQPSGRQVVWHRGANPTSPLVDRLFGIAKLIQLTRQVYPYIYIFFFVCTTCTVSRQTSQPTTAANSPTCSRAKNPLPGTHVRHELQVTYPITSHELYAYRLSPTNTCTN